MATNKTQPNDSNVNAFLDSVAEDKKRADSFKLLKIMQEITSESPKMWGSSIIGFGNYHYKYESGREGDFFIVGFSPRKQNLTLYIMPGFERYEKLMADLGKYKTGKSCLYIKSLDDVDMKILKELISNSVSYMNKKYN
ncbi:MAG: DUF1801 domain-containing protein [Cyclobacteriaceae bacterium]|nr:DUF1801 domain-containing protein [Cyclobacteriaceae bacterium SS2]